MDCGLPAYVFADDEDEVEDVVAGELSECEDDDFLSICPVTPGSSSSWQIGRAHV